MTSCDHFSEAIKKFIRTPSISKKMATNAMIKIKNEFNRENYTKAVKDMLIRLKYL